MPDTIWAAIIGLVGVVLGSAVSEARHWRKDRAVRRLEDTQKSRLREMLEDPEHEFRKLSTLAHTIGADEVHTKRLLIELGARASTDGQPLWKLDPVTPASRRPR